MILIINTTNESSFTEKLRTELASKDIEFEIVETVDKKISHCIGCNFCWLKTPGICSIKDDYELIMKKMIRSDQTWVISDTALGFIDHKGKNIFDRMIPMATMYLKFQDKQMRHVLRYGTCPDIGLIYKGELDRDYLLKWSRRTTLNFYSRSLGVYPQEELKEAVACMH